MLGQSQCLFPSLILQPASFIAYSTDPSTARYNAYSDAPAAAKTNTYASAVAEITIGTVFHAPFSNQNCSC